MQASVNDQQNNEQLATVVFPVTLQTRQELLNWFNSASSGLTDLERRVCLPIFATSVFYSSKNKNGSRPISQAYLLKYAGCSQSRFSSEKYLQIFSDKIFTIKWTKWSEGWCRHINYRRIPQEVKDILRREYSISRDVKRVDFFTGLSLESKEVIETLRESAEKELQATNKHAEGSPERCYQEYLNDRTHILSDYIDKNWEYGQAVALSLSDDENRAGISPKDSALSALHYLSIARQFYYSKGIRTNRVHLQGPSPANLKKEVREALLKGTISIDVKSAHPSIAARLCKCRKTWEFLKNGGDLYEHLLNQMSGDRKTNKKAVKEAVSSALCGRRIRYVYFKLERKIGLMNTQVFACDEYIAELFEGIKTIHKRIAEVGWVAMPDGTRQYLQKFPKPKPGEKGLKDIDAPVLFALLLQAYEYRIWCFARTYMEANNINVVLHLHDGIYIEPTPHIEGLKAEIAEFSQISGIPIKLELQEVTGG